MITVLRAGLPLLQFPLLNVFPEIVHGVTTRHGGVSTGRWASLNLGWSVGDAPEAVAENRRRVYASLGLDPGRGAAGRQVHGTRVAVVGPDGPAGVSAPGTALPDTDALLTAVPGVGLLVIAGDCVPVLLWDPAQRVVGTVHAGWRGTVAGAVGQAVAAMAAHFGSRPGDVRAGIGPAIGPCCYEVDGPVLAPLRAAFPDDWAGLVQPREGDRALLDLWEANRRALLAAGLAPEHIDVAGLCTRCHRDQVYSERAEGRPAGRFGAVIALREGTGAA
ncbi:MAG: peptidoglycan editing factor PgeF [Chloroflexi bacterium]|nr:peptidoglycan editing factor PgeF [Chloroflexota bacterium]